MRHTPGPSTRTALLALATTLSLSAGAGAQTIVGSPSTPYANCIPFTCNLVSAYQQAYSASAFGGPIAIGSLTFYNNAAVAAVVGPASYTIRLSTTTKAVTALDGNFASNTGADVATFFSGYLSGSAAPGGAFMISGTTFNYDPSNGNLLLEIMKGSSSGSGSGGVAMDVGNSLITRIMSGDGGQSGTVDGGAGLVTGFNDPATPLTVGSGPGGGEGGGGGGPSTAPEPATMVLVASGLGGIIGARRRRARTE